MSHWDPKYGPGPSDQGAFHQQMDPSMYFYMMNNTNTYANNSYGPQFAQNPQPNLYTVDQIESQYAQGNGKNHKKTHKNSNNFTKNTNNDVVDVSNSNLHANATEFHPIVQQNNVDVASGSGGAIKKHQNGEYKPKNYNRSRNNYSNDERYERNHQNRSHNNYESAYNNKKQVIVDESNNTNARKYDRSKKDSNKPNKDVAETNSEHKNYDNYRKSSFEFNKNNKYTGNDRNYERKSDSKPLINKESANESTIDQTRDLSNDGSTNIKTNYIKSNKYPTNAAKYDNNYRRSNNYRGNNASNQLYGNKKNDYYEDDATTSTRYSGKSSKSGDYTRSSNNWRQLRSERSNKQSSESIVGSKNVDVGGNEEKTARMYECKPAQQFKKKLDSASQRERLEQMITHRILECLVCCEKLRHSDKIWSCKQCFHILHLNCVIRWARASKLEAGWRCPACQNVCNNVPTEYRCYCDKQREPRVEPGNLPHSCGDVCARKGRSCEHACTLLCHPGPCPECTIMVTRACGCGATKQTVKCCSDLQITCQAMCTNQLNCGVHACAKPCHIGDCAECAAFIQQECFCGKQGKKVPCTQEVQGVLAYACGDACEKLLSCGNHRCVELCHVGECGACVLDPRVVASCPCGQSQLKEGRVSCLDPIPTCDKVCNKRLKCGQPSDPHLCKEKCHVGLCAPCPLTTMVRCRCGHMDRELACRELKSKADDARCQKKCSKKRLCCKHKCNQFCCIEVEHICPLPCNHSLPCGLHRCEDTCHRGRCAPCWRTSFQELYCECGASVLYPPVACGTRPPPCSKPCSRERLCGHENHHNCHSGACPPCIVFTKRWCHGHHEQRGTIPCHQEDFSCGMPCGKDMACGRHKCNQICHKGACPSVCTQLCTIPRTYCEHGCNQRCHAPPCTDTPCKQSVRVTCDCGLRTSTRTCMDIASEYQKIAMSQLAAKMADIQRGQAVDIADIINKPKKGNVFKTLECNDECRLIERNRRLAIGLQIRNPDLSAKLTPKYSEFMRGWAKKDARFCQNIHDKLTELVTLAKQSKQKSRSHSFECMNRDKRHLVHEYCEHFGIESAAYDQEPNRNIVATASRDKSWMPSISLCELFQRENGQRRVPGPVVNKSNQSSAKTNESVSLKLSGRGLPRPATPPGEFVDYFDNPP